ncbi:Rhodanese-related sulfurtransferase [hydrothermal vent metagenome]|uniref:Rhodanese-related sulfurtransferase n=1 Tax=hydrothermal vent metagenome TaxID=652676 RepID=A0A1W1DUM5_9ZZZZ
MIVNNAVSAMAGVFIMGSLLLSGINFNEPNWLWLTFFVGFNLLQSAFTGFCPAAIIFKALGIKDNN